MLKLNRTGNALNRNTRNNDNDNWAKLEKKYNDVAGEITEEVFNKIVDDSRIYWSQMVDTVADLPRDAKIGETRGVKEDNKIYHFDGSNWIPIAEINLNPIAEVDQRLTQQLAETASLSATSDFRTNYYEGPLVSFVFDDGRIEDWERFKPIFESEGVPGCVNVIVSSVGNNNFMTWDQLKELKDMGWTVASHTMTHPNIRDLTESEIEYEYGESSRILKRHGLDYDILVMPHGATTELSRKISRKYYKMAVNIVRPQLSNKIPYIDNQNMTRVAGLSQKVAGVEPTLEECKAMVDEAIANNDYIIFEDHSHYDIYDNTRKLDELRELIQYIKLKGVPIVNLSESFEMKCNIIDFGERDTGNYYRLHRDGSVSSDEDSNVYEIKGNDAYDLDDPIDVYADNKITVWRANEQATHLPLQASGEIKVYKLTSYPNMWYREYRAFNRAYWQTWDDTNNKWREWVSYGDRLTDISVNDLPSPSASHLGRMLSVRMNPSQRRDILVCARDDDGSYQWEKIETTTFSVD